MQRELKSMGQQERFEDLDLPAQDFGCSLYVMEWTGNFIRFSEAFVEVDNSFPKT